MAETIDRWRKLRRRCDPELRRLAAGHARGGGGGGRAAHAVRLPPRRELRGRQGRVRARVEYCPALDPAAATALPLPLPLSLPLPLPLTLALALTLTLTRYAHVWNIVAQPDGSFHWLQSFINHYSLPSWLRQSDARSERHMTLASNPNPNPDPKP